MKSVSYILIILIISTRFEACMNFKNAKSVEALPPEKIIYSNSDEEFLEQAQLRFKILNELISKNGESTKQIKVFCAALSNEIFKESHDLEDIFRTHRLHPSLNKIVLLELEYPVSNRRFFDKYINLEKKFQSFFQCKAYSNGDIEIRAYALKILSVINENLVVAGKIKNNVKNN